MPNRFILNMLDAARLKGIVQNCFKIKKEPPKRLSFDIKFSNKKLPVYPSKNSKAYRHGPGMQLRNLYQ